jgi:poly(hydroxyalkanoate) granule-associated protein
MEPNEKNVQDELLNAAHRIWLAGLGALATAEQEGAKVFSRLVDRGREVEAKGKEQVDEARQKAEEVKEKAEKSWGDLGDKVSGKVDEKLTEALHRLGVPTRDEIRALTQKVEELNAKVEQLKPRTTPAVASAVSVADTKA